MENDGQDAIMGHAFSVPDLSRQIYQGVLAPGGWQAGLSAITEAVGGDHGLITAHDARYGTVDVLANFGVDALPLERLLSATRAGALPSFLRGLPVGRALPSTALISDRELERTDYHEHILRPDGVFYKIMVVLQARARCGSFVGVCRARRAGSFDATETATIQAVVPHLAVALELRQRLRDAELRASNACAALDRLSTGLVLTDATSRPCFINAAAAAILDESDGLLLAPSGLAAATAREATALRRMIAATACATAPHGGDDAAAVAGGRLIVHRPSRRLPLLLRVLPAGMLDLMVPGKGHGPQVMIFIRSADGPREIDAESLVAVFGLTPREADLTVLLARGSTLAEAATALEIRPQSARTYLKRTLDKTGTHRQAELVGLVLRGFAEL